MELWLVYSLLAMLFAGFTAILAKLGLAHIHPDLEIGEAVSAMYLCETYV